MKKLIYVLEDNDDLREIFTYLLEEKAYDVHAYPTATLFKNGMVNAHPDVIILDVMLPDGNGLDICAELKNNHQTQNIPIIMMSAHVHLNDVKEKCRAEDFMSKPFDINDFVKRVDKYAN